MRTRIAYLVATALVAVMSAACTTTQKGTAQLSGSVVVSAPTISSFTVYGDEGRQIVNGAVVKPNEKLKIVVIGSDNATAELVSTGGKTKLTHEGGGKYSGDLVALPSPVEQQLSVMLVDPRAKPESSERATRTFRIQAIGGPPPPPPPPKDTLRDEIDAALKAARRPTFAFDSAKLPPASKEAIAAWADILKRAKPEYAFELIGRADDRGEDPLNDALGLARAAAVRDELVTQGINAGSLTTRTAGKREATKDCASRTWAERSKCYEQDRHVEIRLLP